MKSNVTYCEAKASNQVGKKCSWNEQFKRIDRKKNIQTGGRMYIRAYTNINLDMF